MGDTASLVLCAGQGPQGNIYLRAPRKKNRRRRKSHHRSGRLASTGRFGQDGAHHP